MHEWYLSVRHYFFSRCTKLYSISHFKESSPKEPATLQCMLVEIQSLHFKQLITITSKATHRTLNNLLKCIGYFAIRMRFRADLRPKKSRSHLLFFGRAKTIRRCFVDVESLYIVTEFYDCVVEWHPKDECISSQSQQQRRCVWLRWLDVIGQFPEDEEKELRGEDLFCICVR